MEWIEKIVRFFERAVGENMGRYLLIALLAGLWFAVFGMINMAVRRVLEKAIRKVLFRKDTSKLPDRICLLVTVALAAIAMWAVHQHVPGLSPFHYVDW